MSEVDIIKVKTERPDEAEIRELAAKMVEANKAKVLAASAARPPAVLGTAGQAGPGGQMGILNFLTRKNGQPAQERKEPEPDKKAATPDEASWKGHFGWDKLGKCDIPYIFRLGEKYVAVRMVEVKLLNKYLNYLHQDIYSCTCIRSYYITEIEARLLNEINIKHCDSQFGRETFTQKDLVVRLSDANEFYNFLDVCYNKLLRGTANIKDKCGFIRINKESVVPYTVRDGQKFVPLFYFEGETDNLKLKADQLKGWDLSYLKFCCKVQGIRNELFASETCSVISLSDIKSYFPPGTSFEEYWPTKVVDSQLLVSTAKGSSGGGQWTRAPPAPPPGAIAAGAAAGGPAGGGAGGGGPMRGRRGTTPQHQQQLSAAAAVQRHTAAAMAAAAAAAPHPNMAAAVQQAFANSWSNYNHNNMSQNQHVINRLAQAAVRYGGVAGAGTAGGGAGVGPGVTSHRATTAAALSHQGRQMQFQNNSLMAMGQQPPPLVRNSNTNMTARSGGPASSNGHSGHQQERKRLNTIPDIPTTGTHTPYKVQKALVEGTMVPCINLKPYLYTELLMTLPDLASHFFPRVPLPTCREVLDVLGMELYKPNQTQLQILRNSGKCKSAAAGENGMALVQIRDVIQFMPQLKYMLMRSGAPLAHAHAHDAAPAKRAPPHSAS